MTTDPSAPPYLGAHMSISGGLHLAFERIQEVQGTALQIFLKNQRQWKSKPLASEDVDTFKKAWSDWGDFPVGAHDSYLINLAATDPEILDKSVNGFADELARCEALSIPFLITHPGSHKGKGEQTGLREFTANMDLALERSETSNVLVLLENTAGQGSNLGYCFEHLVSILEQSRHPERIGVCFDTCHAHGAGYDITTEAGYASTFARFDALIGLDRLRFFHVNDSKSKHGSKTDRHEHIGKGALGLEPFRRLLNEKRFLNVPKVLETPKGKGKDLAEDARNLATLRTLIQG